MQLYYIIILICSLAGLGWTFMVYKKRDRVVVKEDDPRDHIKGMYFLKIPYEKIIIGFFGLPRGRWNP